MRDLAEGLAKQEARLGGQDVDPPAGGLAGDDAEILVWQVPSEAEPEPPFTCGRAVAGPHIATGLAERGHDVVSGS